ncbi:Uncharacterized oxidoreductase C663 [Seminavis robusta]|uniref:Uncharacterized oxidoreductase C663 n=1 Tax=Seminavis robusta TaxID=568900 RepID=A0A9N8EQC2_9STRA|nr:Uncharacterized oxidoreductase C663 [Seminavis robusta]|eukprot:Sro1337_g264110.1 Uncharacterized oxidoreductase C663 (341) ;mRNA; f:13815-14837
MLCRLWRQASVAAVLIFPRATTVAFAALPPTHKTSVIKNLSTVGTGATSLSATGTTTNGMESKIEAATPVNGIPGQDIKEEQPVRNPITESSTVLVVGGGRGIGLEFVHQCAGRGATVIATHRGSDISTDLKTFMDDTRYNIEALSLDVGDEESIANAAKELKARLGDRPLTHVIHSAGTYMKGMSFDGTSRGGRPPQPVVTKEDMMTTYLVNAVGPLLVAQAFAPLMGPAPGSDEKHLPVYSILTSKVGSVYDNTSGGTYAYRSSKSALNNIAKSLSVDLAGEASVVLLHPGFVRTDMTGGKGLIDTPESVSGMLRAVETTDATVGFRFVDFKACIIPW